jgi:hypothetical protein
MANLAAQISKAGGEFELVEREIAAPGAGGVRIKCRLAAFVIAINL